MRRPVVLVGLVALVGGVLGAVGVLVSYWWLRRSDARVTDFGWYAVKPVQRRYVDYLPTSSTRSTDWVQLLWPAIVGGAVGAVLLTGLAWLAYRRLRTR